jgi:hypothetical protein
MKSFHSFNHFRVCDRGLVATPLLLGSKEHKAIYVHITIVG